MLEQIGRYRVDAELGRGAMGVVYRAHDPAIGRSVAIKTIHLPSIPHGAERDKLRDRLRREAQSAGMLSHPNIVTVYDLLEEGDDVFIFMEYVQGPTLESLMNKGEALEPARVLGWLEGLAAALDFAHSKGIVHRDVKPSNVMLHDGEIAKLADFGVARINADAVAASDSTLTGTLLGTPNYMSPEQIQGERVDGRADQFALAVLAYELLTGDRPFTGESVPTLIFKIVNTEPQPARRVNGSLPEEVDDVFRRALHKQRHYRYPSCRDFVADLAKALALKADWKPIGRGASEDLPTQVEQPAPAVNLPPARPVERDEPVGSSRWRGGIWLLAVGLLAAAGGGAWWWMNQPGPAPEAPPTVEAKPTPEPPPAVKPAVQPERKVETRTPAPVKPGPTPPVEPPVQTDAKLHDLHIDSKPEGAAITIDDGRGCLTPCDIQVPAGRHVVRVARDGYTSESRTIEVPAQSTVFVELKRPMGTVMVHTTPAGATVIVDGREWSQKTPARIQLPPGLHKLEFVYPGFPKQEQEVNVKDGAFATLDINWSNPK